MSFPVFVKSIINKTITVQVSPTDTIGDLKSKIYDQEKMKVEDQYLFYVGKPLGDDKKTIADYDIQPNHTIHAAVRVNGG